MPDDLVPMEAAQTRIRPVWSMLNKGATGSGKSVLSGSKYFRPTYVFNLEGRFESVTNFYIKLDGHAKDLFYNDFSMAQGSYYKLDQKMDSIVARPEYRTVVIASLTSYIHIVLKNLLGATETKSMRVKGGIQANILEDYNFEDAAIIFELCAFLQQLKEMGVNVILEAHISPYELVTLEKGQRIVTTINQILTKGKKAPAQIPGYFNEVWHFDKLYEGEWGKDMKARYRVNTMGSSLNECKTSFGIPSFEWSNMDPGTILERALDPDIAKNPIVDPNAPKRVSW
jgi:hypothetical protein